MSSDRPPEHGPGDAPSSTRNRASHVDGPDPRYYVNGVYRPPRRALRPPPHWRARCGFGVALAGLATLIVGSIAARTSIFRLSWDSHHMRLQLLGMAISAVGVFIATTGRPSK